MDHLDNEPASLPDDTKPRPAVEIPEPEPSSDDTASRAPIEYSRVEPIEEPARAQGDTEPRPPVITELAHSPESVEPEEERPGCANRLLIVAVLLAFVFLCVAAVGLAAYAGWRDGSTDYQNRKAAALVGTIGAQVTLAADDCSNGRYELCLVRCTYIATQQPSYPGMDVCINQAQIALSATPTSGPTTTATPEPPTITPTPNASITATVAGAYSREDLFVRAQSAINHIDYESAMQYLEALRGLDANYNRKQVEDMLVQTYEALGSRYKSEGRLSEMVVVINKALSIRPLPDTDWQYTVNVTQLYLDGKAELLAGDIKDADTTFNKFMIQGSNFLADGNALACEAFAKAGDTKAQQTYKCQ